MTLVYGIQCLKLFGNKRLFKFFSIDKKELESFKTEYGESDSD